MRNANKVAARRPQVRTLFSSLGVAVAAVALAVGTAGSAHAATMKLTQGDDWGSLTSGGDVRVCDGEADGNTVRFKVAWEGDRDDDVWTDSNGSAAGCAGGSRPEVSKISYIQLCEIRNNLPDSCVMEFVTWGD
jgi:hypothetical protein